MQNILGKTITTCFVLVTLASLQAQSRISVKASDTLDFVLSVNEVQINSYPCFSLAFDHAESGKMNFNVTFSHNPIFSFSQSLNVKKNSAVFYEIEKSKGAYKLVMKSESMLAAPAAEKTTGNPNNEMPAFIASTAFDSTAEASFSGDCEPPVSQDIYDKMLADVNESYFETRKLEVMTAFVSANCLRVEQLRYMMSRLSMEDNKFMLMKSSKGHLYDPENLKKAAEDFFLEKNKARVQQWISGS